jgi:transforming growth factor-beta-induced protein
VTRLLPLATLTAFLSVATAADHCAKPTAKPTSIVKTAATAGQFKTLLSLLVAADLDDALKGDGPFTVFAPTDDAFAKLPKGTVEELLKPENKAKLTAILTYHVVTGKDRFNFDNATPGTPYEFKTLNGAKVNVTRGDGVLKVNESTIQVQNVACSNGSVQVIDAVLLPPAAKKNTIPTVAEKAGTFKTLLAAVTAAELAEVLAGDGPFTVFAPTDEAFAKLPKGTVEKLLKPENRKQLVGILKYHVVAGKLSAKELVKADGAKTLEGGRVGVSISGGRVTVNRSTIVASDVAADNGVIHVIDTVLMPSH